ncbi:hypothetical protein P280DRAFT_32283 [Massarina eburnea CBS 473.64]|uniref:Uncharacterized protein n=1 Tax=Massarina eburnea CBS 473.64 TaxID=1395130 RepID=A0A6A6RZP9_9PLEO|nr:hypothetical protein P280DRAFT_32283 [Massarina eburnea CBS 473.64]
MEDASTAASYAQAMTIRDATHGARIVNIGSEGHHHVGKLDHDSALGSESDSRCHGSQTKAFKSFKEYVAAEKCVRERMQQEIGILKTTNEKLNGELGAEKDEVAKLRRELVVETNEKDTACAALAKAIERFVDEEATMVDIARTTATMRAYQESDAGGDVGEPEKTRRITPTTFDRDISYLNTVATVTRYEAEKELAALK